MQAKDADGIAVPRSESPSVSCAVPVISFNARGATAPVRHA